jgi:hypothetical protein
VIDAGAEFGFGVNGLWWEPGAFALFINLAVIFTIINDELTLKRYILFAIIILFISSTTGSIVFLLLSLILLKKVLVRKNIFVLFNNLAFNNQLTDKIYDKLEKELPKGTILCCTRPPNKGIDILLNYIQVKASWDNECEIFFYRL